MEQTRQAMSEDWLSVWIGLLVFLLSLGVLVGSDILGWVVTTGVWNDLSKALTPASKAYASIGGIGALIATYVALLAVMTAGAVALKADIKRFLVGFSAVFLISYLCWIIGSYANFAVTTPADMQKFGITWSLKLTNEGGFIVALIAGLIVGNFLADFAEWMKEAVRPEWYIKTAIVILGGFLGITAAEKLSLATSLMFRGLAHHRSISDLLGRRLFRSAQVVQIQPRMGSAARFWNLHLRRIGSDRYRQRDPRSAGGSHHGGLAGRDLCRR